MAVEENISLIQEELNDTDILFLTTCFGGGTGTGFIKH
jgi:cell division GTPase FtsZ